ncbi:UNVERIFIED_CONTAM: imidazole glycerol phosphate synthase subunit HisH, partial [Bacillus sp. ATCC 13368]
KLKDCDQAGNRLKVPHMGWNLLKVRRGSALLPKAKEGFAYFVHSYYVSGIEEEALLASAEYGVCVPAVVGLGNVYGAQFHPEKSSTVGMLILERFKQFTQEQKVKNERVYCISCH